MAISDQCGSGARDSSQDNGVQSINQWFLNDICHGLHLDTLYFIDIFKGIQLAGLLMLYDADLVTKSL